MECTLLCPTTVVRSYYSLSPFSPFSSAIQNFELLYIEETVAEVANLVRIGGNEGCLNTTNITMMDNNLVATQLLTTLSEEEERSCSDTSSSLGELSSCDAVTT